MHVPSDGTLQYLFLGTDGIPHRRVANYNAELSTEWRPVYDYVVQPGDPKADLIKVIAGFNGNNLRGRTTTGTITNTRIQWDGDAALQTFEQENGTDSGVAQFGVDGRPKVQNVDILKGPAITHTVTDREHTWTTSDAFRGGEPIDVTTVFDQNVTVEGRAGVSIRVGDGPRNWRGAGYHSGSGSKILVFRYTVKAADRDDTGIRVDSGGIASDGSRYGFYSSGSITFTTGDIEASPSYSGFKDRANMKVDGRPIVLYTETVSEPAHGDTYGTGEDIEVALNYNNRVVVSEDLVLDLEFHDSTQGQGPETKRHAAYSSGSGTKQLVFSDTVQQGDKDDDGFSMWLGGGDYRMSGGTVTALGTDVEANPDYSSIWNESEHKVDAVAPKVTSISIISDPGDDDTYGVGDEIQLTAQFDKDLVVTLPDLSQVAPADLEKAGAQGITIDQRAKRITLPLTIGDSTVLAAYGADESSSSQLVLGCTVKHTGTGMRTASPSTPTSSTSY